MLFRNLTYHRIIFTCPIGHVGCRFHLPEDAFHLPRAIGQPLMSNPVNKYPIFISFYFYLKRLYADEKLQYFQLPYIPCRMVSGNEIKLCLKYFCLPIYFVHFEISLTFISPKPSPKPLDVQLLSTRHITKVHLL